MGFTIVAVVEAQRWVSRTHASQVLASLTIFTVIPIQHSKAEVAESTASVAANVTPDSVEDSEIREARWEKACATKTPLRFQIGVRFFPC